MFPFLSLVLDQLAGERFSDFAELDHERSAYETEAEFASACQSTDEFWLGDTIVDLDITFIIRPDTSPYATLHWNLVTVEPDDPDQCYEQFHGYMDPDDPTV